MISENLFSARSLEFLERAKEIARQQGDTKVDTDHLLLSLLSERQGNSAGSQPPYRAEIPGHADQIQCGECSERTHEDQKRKEETRKRNRERPTLRGLLDPRKSEARTQAA